MPLTRLFAAGLWLTVTVASTVVVWAATSTVAADVTDQPAQVLARSIPSADASNNRNPAGASRDAPGPPAASLPAQEPDVTVAPERLFLHVGARLGPETVDQ